MGLKLLGQLCERIILALHLVDDILRQPRDKRGVVLRVDEQRPLILVRRQLVEEVHRLAGGMRPSILDDYGLDSALARHIEKVSQHSGLNIDYQFTCPPWLERLPSRVEVL